MPNDWWADLKAKWNAFNAHNYDALIAAFHHTIGSSGGAEARGRLVRRKATDAIHRQWNFARGAYDLKPTPRDVSRFVRDTFDIPLDLSNVADDAVFNRAQLDLVFEGVAKVLIGRGDFTVEMP
jgi:hypothetical protein